MLKISSGMASIPWYINKMVALLKDVTRQVLYDGAFDIPCQFRYFECLPGGYSTLGYHEHTHMVMIFRGKGKSYWAMKSMM